MNCLRGQRNPNENYRKYPVAVRKFALTMNYHSPKAYRYLREKFNNALPHPSTLRKWFANSNINGEPGILQDAMRTLQNLSDNRKQNNKKLIISLSMDETAMKCNVQWLHEQKKFSGFVTQPKQNGEIPMSKNVLVFMATVLEENVSIPIAYYLVTGLNGLERANMLTRILTELHKIGVVVMNIVFDGLGANFTMCEVFGASFDPGNMVTHILHPVDGSKIYILLDACHMLKLIRSTLGDYGKLQDPEVGTIDWKYFERLVSYRERNRFVTHRLNKHHILYTKNRMNVKLAAQIFSKGVASTMAYLRKNGERGFTRSKATSEFSYTMNDLFDVFNAKRVNKNEQFKSAITKDNANRIFSFFDRTITKLMSLRLKGVKCVNSRRSTGFIGFIVNMISVRSMYEDFVLTGDLECLALFYNSQDMLESFFSRIRGVLGYNDNPTAQEFKAAIRKLLFYNEITSSIFANCADNLNILTVSSVKESISQNIISTNSNTEENSNFEQNFDENYEENEEFFEEIYQLRESSSDFEVGAEIKDKEDVTIAFVAGVIEKKVSSSKFGCNDCLTLCENLFKENDKVSGEFIESIRTQRPCKSSFMICKHAHDVFDENLDASKFDYKPIYNRIAARISTDVWFPNTDFSHNEEHKSHLIAFIVDEYVRAYATYVAQCLTLEHQQMLIRNANRKLTHFKGQ